MPTLPSGDQHELELTTSSRLVLDEMDAVLVEAGLEGSLRPMLLEAIRAQAGGGETPLLRRSFWTLLVCQLLGGNAMVAAPAGAAIEFFAASLDVFDDLEDLDSEDALYRRFGHPQATNAATALLLLTQLAVSRLKSQGIEAGVIARVMETIARAGLTACVGQQYDLDWEASFGITEAQYYEMTAKKSGALVECACTIGALLTSAGDAVAKAFGVFGRNLGLAAQINNDVRSLEMGRAHKNDIVRRKKTLPVVFALSQAPNEDRRWLAGIYQSKEEIEPEIELRILEVLRRAGAIHYSIVQSELHKQKAVRALADARVAPAIRQRLGEVLGVGS